MRKIKSTDHRVAFNKLYLKFNKSHAYDLDRVIAFNTWLTDRYGITLRLLPKTDPKGHVGYELTEVYVVNEQKYTWFLLETAG
jgi:hypothetical protein